MNCPCCEKGLVRIVDFPAFNDQVLICEDCLNPLVKEEDGVFKLNQELKELFDMWDNGRGILAKRVKGYPVYLPKNQIA